MTSSLAGSGRESDLESVVSEVTDESFDEEINEVHSMNLDLKLPENSRVVSRALVRRFSPPEELTTPLLPYQHEGMAWMCNQEEEADCRGGVLADEMGMGKTLQMLALILKRRGQVRGPTLVVCPVTAMSVWADEIRRSVSPSAGLRVHIHHGNRKAAKAELEGYDVVITSYDTLERQYRSLTAQFEMVVCEYCGESYKLSALPAHKKRCVKDFQEKRIKNLPVKSKEEVKRELDGGGYCTPKRESMVKSEVEGGSSSSRRLSYGCKSEGSTPSVRKSIQRSTPRLGKRILSQQRKALKEGNGPHSVKWARVILDEAHRIKGRTNSTAKSIYHLTTTFRWAVSGTPFQNKVGDLYALV
ncbi:hypothetical protein FOL47_010597, partial [Perkinsus chesapeaki]